MRLLLDTHVLLWAAMGSPRLSAEAAKLIAAPSHERIFSAASLWEIGIKSGLGREDFSVDASQLRLGLLANGFSEWPILGAHVLLATKLPPLHKDPFDRILVAQTMADDLTLVTSDAAVAAYSPSIRRI